MSAATVRAGLDQIRLRPVVHASPTPDGLHLRGWSSSVSMAGSAALWRVWEALSVRLVEGRCQAELDRLSPRPEVQAVVDTLLAQLREHDMLVTLPADWPPPGVPAATATWLESAADDPATVWSRLADAVVAVDGVGPVADAAVRALRTTGVTTTRRSGRGRLRLTSGRATVTAEADDSAGYVLPAGSCAEAAALAARLELADGLAPAALAGIVGGAAAHRLVCAVAGLADPGGEVASVLVARLDPLRADYHQWPLPAGQLAPTDLEQALTRLEALTDADVGPAAVIDAYELPQTPAGLFCLDVGAGQVVGVGATTDGARLQAGLAAAEQLGGAVIAGCDELEATGRWLRRLVEPGVALPDEVWCEHPAARRWWKALTLRLGVEAEVRVSTVAPGVHHAAVLAAGDTIGSGVEARPDEAAAYALLAAVGLVQWRQDRRAAPARFAAPCGAAPERAADPLSWQSPSWIWPAGNRAEEPAFQQRLRDISGATVPGPLARAGHVLLAERS